MATEYRLTKIMYDGYLSHTVTKEYLVIFNRKRPDRIFGQEKEHLRPQKRG